MSSMNGTTLPPRHAEISDAQFSINRDEELTALVKDWIGRMDWQARSIENASRLEEPEEVLPDLDTTQYDGALGRLMHFKDITTLTPPSTRFRFAKRVMRRLMMVTNAFQQEFNNAAFELLESLARDERLAVQQSMNAAMNRKLEEHKAVQLSLAQQAHELRGQLDELKESNDAMRGEIATFEGQCGAVRHELEQLAQAAQQANEELEQARNGNSLLAKELAQIKESVGGMSLSLADETYMESSSQAGEDAILSYALKMLGIPLRGCDYIDLGANHPRLLSNTYFLYQHGARGVLVEANPFLAEKLREERKGDIVLNNVVSTKGGEQSDFYVMNGDGLSTTSLESAQSFIKENSQLEITKVIQVPTITFQQIVDRYLGHAPVILNIDIEGAELDILTSIDFERCRPLFIIVEMIPYKASLVIGQKNQSILAFLQEKGYSEYAFTGINSIFIDMIKARGSEQ